MSTTQPGWIEPADKTRVAEYWLTRREADAAPGYGGFGPDFRVKCRWNGEAWIAGYRDGVQRREPHLVCLHSNNGWRIEGEAKSDLAELAIQCRETGRIQFRIAATQALMDVGYNDAARLVLRLPTTEPK